MSFLAHLNQSFHWAFLTTCCLSCVCLSVRPSFHFFFNFFYKTREPTRTKLTSKHPNGKWKLNFKIKVTTFIKNGRIVKPWKLGTRNVNIYSKAWRYSTNFEILNHNHRSKIWAPIDSNSNKEIRGTCLRFLLSRFTILQFER